MISCAMFGERTEFILLTQTNNFPGKGIASVRLAIGPTN